MALREEEEEARMRSPTLLYPPSNESKINNRHLKWLEIFCSVAIFRKRCSLMGGFMMHVNKNVYSII